MRRRRLQAVGMAVLLAAGGAYALASWDWCGRWERTPAKLESSARGSGALKAGAAEVALQPPWPVTVAGYGPMRPTASRASRTLKARALVLQAGEVTAAMVAIDLLLVNDAIVAEVRAKSGLPDAWVVATHAHSSMGNHDPRPLAELAGTGWYRAQSKDAIVRAAVDALTDALKNVRPATASLATVTAGLCKPRTGEACDQRLTRLVLTGEDGAPIAESVLLAAHPTLVARKTESADPDYPGAFAEKRADAGVALVMQGAGGNASAASAEPGPLAFADAIAAKLPVAEVIGGPVALAIARATVTLPHPDAARLVPGFSRVPATNFVCVDAARTAEVSALRLGPLLWLAVPVEVSLGAGERLEAAAQATRVVSLANGYLGYLEPADVVAVGGGESKRQYYAAGLQDALEQAATLAANAVR